MVNGVIQEEEVPVLRERAGVLAPAFLQAAVRNNAERIMLSAEGGSGAATTNLLESVFQRARRARRTLAWAQLKDVVGSVVFDYNCSSLYVWLADRLLHG